MSEIVRLDVNEEWAHSGIIKAGEFCFLGYCVGNVGGTIEEQPQIHSNRICPCGRRKWSAISGGRSGVCREVKQVKA